MLPWEKPLALIDVEVDRKHYNYCYGCGTDNPLGLKLAFRWDGITATTEFTAGKVHQGWPETMHGGIVCSLLDEAIGWAAYFKGIKGVTGKLVVRLRQPVAIGQTLSIAAMIVKESRKLVQSRATISLSDGTVAAEATATIYVIPQNGHKGKP